MVQFGVYLDQIFSLKNFKHYHFLYKFKKKKTFIYKKFFLDTCLLWSNSHEEIFENILRLMRFGVLKKS